VSGIREVVDVVDVAEPAVAKRILEVDVAFCVPFTEYGTNLGDLPKDGSRFLLLSSSSSSSNIPESPSPPALV
jgi:hypothetical protein